MTGALMAMLALGAVCWLLKAMFIVFVPAHRLPTPLTDALRHLPPAVLAALVAVEADALARGGDPMTGACVVATLAAILLAVRRTGSLLLGIAISLGAALLLDLALLS